jgi:hypothetical protein
MKRFIIFLSVLPVLISGQVMAETADPIQTMDDSPTAVIVMLAIGLLILLVLTLWLLKNSYHLKEIEEDTDTNGEVWLSNHLNDLNSHQLDLLIKRQSLTRKQALKDENT